MATHRTRRASLLAVLSVVCTLAWTEAALAQAWQGNDAAVIDQYVEEVPTSTGSTGGNNSGTNGPGGGGTAETPLAADVRTELYGTLAEDQARVLETVATSTRYGAPTQTASNVSKPKGGTGTPRETAPEPREAPGAVSAAISALADGGGGNPIGLFVALLGITGLLLATAALARRGARTSTTA